MAARKAHAKKIPTEVLDQLLDRDMIPFPPPASTVSPVPYMATGAKRPGFAGVEAWTRTNCGGDRSGAALTPATVFEATGTTPALAWVINAIVDALAEFGVRHA